MAEPRSHRPPQLALCRSCGEFVREEERACPHCAEDLVASAVRYNQKRRDAGAAAKKLQEMLQQLSLATD